MVVGGVEKRLRGGPSFARPSRGLALRTCDAERAAVAARIVAEEAEVVLREIEPSGGKQPARAQQVAVDVAADDALGEPVGGDVRRGSDRALGSWPRRRRANSRTPRRIAEARARPSNCRSRPKLRKPSGAPSGFSSARARLAVVRHERSGRLLVMRIGVAQQDSPERNAMPGIALGGPAVAEDDRVVPVPSLWSPNGIGCDRPSAKPKCSRPMPFLSSWRSSASW